MKKLSTLIFSFILSVTLVWQPVRAESDGGRLTSYPHEEIDFTSLEYERPDTDDLRELIESLPELCGDISNMELGKTAVDALEQELIKLLDMPVLVEYKYRNNPSDKELYLEYTYINEELQDLFQLYKEALKDVLLSPCKDAAYTYYSLQDAESIIASESLTDKERELMRNSTALCQKCVQREEPIQDNGFGSINVFGNCSLDPSAPLIDAKIDNGMGKVNIYFG